MPQSVEARCRLAAALRDAGRTDEAVEVWRDARRILGREDPLIASEIEATKGD